MREIHSKANKVFLWGLIGLALVIWGNFAYKLLTNIDPSTETPVSKPKHQIQSSDNSALDSIFKTEFSGIFRDPFVGSSNIEGNISTFWDNEEYIISEQPVYDLHNPHSNTNSMRYPEIRLLGIIGSTAVLLMDGETLYAKSGDIGLYGEVLEISSKYVKIYQAKEIITLILDYADIQNNAPEQVWFE